MHRSVNPEPSRNEADWRHADSLGRSDTIAAIATAPGESGIAVVRVSGPAALAIADAVFIGRGLPPSECAAGTFHLGHARPAAAGHTIAGRGSQVDNRLLPPRDAEAKNSRETRAPSAEPIHPRRPPSPAHCAPAREAAKESPQDENGCTVILDQVILLVFRAPHSFTGEDVVEFQGHGGRTCSQRILRATLDAGARLADPGEFTRRAFLNGRIDLLQAEAVLDLIKARTDAASSAALCQLDGVLSTWTATAYETLKSTLAEIETSLDFSEDDLPPLETVTAAAKLSEVERRFSDMIRTWNQGRLMRNGARVVIAGQPNSGKSTLMNRLAGLDRSIVSEHPGTTRDIIEEELVIDGHLIVLSDTAGLRDSDCPIEQDGIRRARRKMEEADLVLYVIDSSASVSARDLESIRSIGPDRCVVVLNKSDLDVIADTGVLKAVRHVSCSARSGDGVPRLAVLTIEALGLKAEPESQVSISERHRACLVEGLARIREAIELLTSGDERLLVPTASSLRRAMEQLDTMTGRSCSSEVLDAIFSRFCIGK